MSVQLSLNTFQLIFLTGILIIAAGYDIKFQKIPNLLNYPTIIVALVYHSATDGLKGLLFSLGGLTLGVAILTLPYLIRGMGAGDVKLMGAVGAIIGPRKVFLAFLLTSIVGGVYALALLLINRQSYQGVISRYLTTLKIFLTTGHFVLTPASEDEKKPRLCYGVAIALGTFFSIFIELPGLTLI